MSAAAQSFTAQIAEAVRDHAENRVTVGALLVRSLVGHGGSSAAPLSAACLITSALDSIAIDLQNAANSDTDSTPTYALSNGVLHATQRMEAVGILAGRLLDEAAGHTFTDGAR